MVANRLQRRGQSAFNSLQMIAIDELGQSAQGPASAALGDEIVWEAAQRAELPASLLCS